MIAKSSAGSARLLILAALAAALTACASEDASSDVDQQALFDDLCGEAGIDCSGGKGDAVATLVGAYFDHDGDLAEAGADRIERYRDRMHSSYAVHDSDGSVLSGLGGLNHCFWSPGDCRVTLSTETFFTNGVTISDAMDALYGDWRLWWRHSTMIGDLEVLGESAPGPDGEPYNATSFSFQPLGRTIGNASLVDIDAIIHAPQAIDGGFRIPIRMNGPAFTCATEAPCMQIDLIDDGDRVRLVERWGTADADERMMITGPLRRFPAVAAVLHIWSSESNAILRPTLGYDPLGGETGWVGLTDFLEATSHPELGEIPFSDQIHPTDHDPLRVTVDEKGDYVIVGGTTVDRINAPPSQVMAALFGDWSCWWKHGAVDNLEKIHGASGDIIAQSYDLTPLALPALPPLTRVHELMSAPYEVTDSAWTEGRAWRIDVELQGSPGSGGGNSFAGFAHFDIQERADGTTRVLGHFDEVRPLGLFGIGKRMASLATTLHGMAEQGTMPPPVRGTGLPGLVQLLQLGNAASDDPACLDVRDVAADAVP